MFRLKTLYSLAIHITVDILLTKPYIYTCSYLQKGDQGLFLLKQFECWGYKQIHCHHLLDKLESLSTFEIFIINTDGHTTRMHTHNYTQSKYTHTTIHKVHTHTTIQKVHMHTPLYTKYTRTHHYTQSTRTHTHTHTLTIHKVHTHTDNSISHIDYSVLVESACTVKNPHTVSTLALS